MSNRFAYSFLRGKQSTRFCKAENTYRLNVPAGTSVRFEPGDSKEVELCELGGHRIVYGFNSLTMGGLVSSVVRKAAFEKAKKQGYKGA